MPQEIRSCQTSAAPKPVGPYSQAIIAGDYVFLSGQIGIDPAIGNIVSGGAAAEAEQSLRNLEEVLKAADLNTCNVVRTEIFLTDINDFAAVNEVYARHFQKEPQPARQAVAVAALPKGARVEISAVAYRPKNV